MNSNKTFFYNILLTFARQGIALLLGLLLTILIARTMGPEGQGIYSLIILLPTLLTTFLNLGIGTSAVYYANLNVFSLHSIVKTNGLLGLALSGISIIGGSIIILFFSDVFFNGVSKEYLFLILFVTPIMFLNIVLQTIFQGKQDFKSFNAVLLGGQFVNLLIAFIGLYIFSFGMEAAILSYIIGQTVSFIFILILLKKKHRVQLKKGKLDKTYIGKALNFGLKSHISNILAFLNYRSDILLLSFFLNPAAVGLYTVAVNIVERLWIISNSISTVLFPKIASLDNDETKNQLTAFISRQSFIITIVISIFLVFISEPIILLLFGEEYRKSVPVLLWLLPGIISGSVSKIIANDFAGRGKPELNLYVSIVTVSINILLNIILIPRFGMIATAFASSATYTLNLIVKLFIFKRITHYSIKEFTLFSKSDFQWYKGVFRKVTRKYQ
jgi:O-antigen/teichoic acid export membrane protein